MPQARVTPGRLYVVATPIGNLEDITYRAVRVLGEVDIIAAEDTRTARVLLDRYGIKTRATSYYRENEARRSAALIRDLRAGRSVAVISEAGTPGVSDPGHRLVLDCLAAGIEVDVVPGPSAALAALVISGLPTERFLFVGFLPRKAGPLAAAVGALAAERGTLILYESPRRLAGTLAALAAVLPGRRAVVARELTKRFQEVARGSLPELVARFGGGRVRGEVVILVEGAAEAPPLSEAELEQEVGRRVAAGERPRQIADALAALGRRRVYQLALALAGPGSGGGGQQG